MGKRNRMDDDGHASEMYHDFSYDLNYLLQCTLLVSFAIFNTNVHAIFPPLHCQVCTGFRCSVGNDEKFNLKTSIQLQFVPVRFPASWEISSSLYQEDVDFML